LCACYGGGLQLDAVSKEQLFGRSAFVQSQYGEGKFRYILLMVAWSLVCVQNFWVEKKNGWEYIEMDHKGWGCELYKCGRIGTSGSEHDSKPSGSIKCPAFADHLWNC